MAATTQSSKAQQVFLNRFLDPISLLSEAIYGVLIVLTFTLTFRAIDSANSSVARAAATEQVDRLVVAALGCALAWGLIDGMMYVLTSMFERGEKRRLLHAIQSAGSEDQAVRAIADELDDMLAPVSAEDERGRLYHNIYQNLRDKQPRPVGFKREDFLAALGCPLVSVLVALPVVLPLLLFRETPALAVRLSNIVAFAMLFFFGYRWAKYIGSSPWKTGWLLVALGVLMMVIAIPLGG